MWLEIDAPELYKSGLSVDVDFTVITLSRGGWFWSLSLFLAEIKQCLLIKL